MPDLTPDRKSVFGRALELPAADRPAYLDAACAGHPALRAEVEELLQAHGGAGSFMNAAPVPEAVTVSAPGNDPEPTRSHRPAVGQEGGIVAGRYKLLQQIGEGGMGTVWMADQTEPVKRRVAVKLIRVERGASKTVLSRFEAERQAIALMNHPNIAKLLDAGTTEDGAPFFVMELVKGVPLTEFCDAHKLSVPDRLDLFGQICSAVHHAHQKGVIHRDLKPTNILVESHDGKPVPKVIDFGLAKATTGLQLTEHTLFTAFGTVAGTPLYMAPEQATFNAVDVDSRADIYALGVILYELLSGSTPIPRDTLKKAALDEMLRVIREQEPPPPSSRIGTSAVATSSVAAVRQSEPAKLGRFVKGELDWIVMKALSKERERRYESATAFAADVGRFLAHEPVTAGPPSQWYRLRKFVRRNKAQVTAATVAALLLVAGVVGTSLGMLAANQATARAVAEEEKAVAERDEKVKALDAEQHAREEETAAKERLRVSLATERQTTYDLTIAQVQKALEDSDQPRAAELLKSCPEDLRGWEWNYLTRQFDRNAVTIRPSFGPTRVGRDATYLTPDSKQLLVLTQHPLGLHTQYWDTATGKKTSEKLLIIPRGVQERPWYTVSPDRRLVAVWEPPTNFFRNRDERSLSPMVPKQVPSTARAVRIYDLQTGDRVGELRGHTSWVYHVIFSDDSRQVVTGGSDQTIRFWQTDGTPGVVFKGHTKAAALPLAFTPDGRSLISAGRDLKTPLPLGTPAMWKLDASIKERDEWFVWDLETGTPRTRGDLAHVPLEHFVGFDPTLAVSQDGKFAILPAWMSSTVVDLESGKRVSLPENEQPLGFRQGGRSSVVLMLDGRGIVTPVNLSAPGDVVTRHRLSIPTKEGSNDVTQGNGTPPWSWNLSRDGRILAIGRDREKKTVIVDTVRGGEIGFIPDKRLAYLPGHQPFVGGRNWNRVIAHDGSFVTSGDVEGEIKLWRLGDVRPAFGIPPDFFQQDFSKLPPKDPGSEKERTRTAKLFSRRYVAVVLTTFGGSGNSGENTIQLEVRDRATDAVVLSTPRYDASYCDSLQFDAKDRLIAFMVKTVDQNPKLRVHTAPEYTPIIWDLTTGQELVKGKPFAAPFGGNSTNRPRLALNQFGAVMMASFVPDDASVRSQQQTGHWQLEDLGSGRPPFQFPPQAGRVFEFGPGAKSGLFIAQGGPHGADAEVWDLERHEVLWTISGADHRHEETHGVFSPDGRRLILFDGELLGTNGNRPQSPRPLSVSVWDVPGRKKVCAFNPPAEALAIRPYPLPGAGNRVVCGDTVWNAETGRPLVRLTDGMLPNASRPSGWSTDVIRGIVSAALSEGKKGPVEIWKPTRPLGETLSDARNCLDESRADFDPARAVVLAKQARDAYPVDSETVRLYGEALLKAGRADEAVPVLEQVLRMYDAFWPNKDQGFTICFQLAVAHHEAGRHRDAQARFYEGVSRVLKETALREKLPRYKRLTTRNDLTPESLQRSMADTAAKLGVPVPSLQLEAVTRDSDVSLRECLIFRAMRFAGEGKHGEAIKVATECVANEPLSRDLAYNAACVFALAGENPKADPTAQAGFADRAITLLKQSVALGWEDVDHLKADEDLKSLQGRDDFKRLLSELGAKYSPRIPQTERPPQPPK